MSKAAKASRSSLKPVTTYADYLEANFHDTYDRYAWLVDFFRNGRSNLSVMGFQLHVRVIILDSYESIIKSRRFKVQKEGLIDQDLVDALGEERGNRRTRLLFVQYRSFEDVNPKLIDLIGLHFDLHPDFFSVHLECDFDQTGQMISHLPSHTLPSERRFLQIRTDEWTFMTSTWKTEENSHTCKMTTAYLNPLSIFHPTE